MTHPATRILGLLELLQAHQQLTGGELARRLGVDTRTVRRYAARLAEMGIPVRADRGRYGGYRLLPGYRLPPLMLTDDEAVAVMLGLVAGERLGLATDAPAVGTAHAKLQRVLPQPLRVRVDAVRETVGFTVAARDATAPATEVLLVLGEAARQRRRVRLTYRSWRGEDTERDLDPYGLVFHSGRWYVTGHDHRRAQTRTFRLDRIGRVVPRPDTFTPPADFDPVAHVTGSLAGVAYRWDVEVLLETSLAAARRRIGPTVGTLTGTSDGVVLRTRAEHLAGMAQLLAGLGWPFVIRRPDELRAEVRQLAARLRQSAERTDG